MTFATLGVVTGAGQCAHTHMRRGNNRGRAEQGSHGAQLHVQHEADGPALELLPVADGIGKAVEGREGPSSPKRP